MMIATSDAGSTSATSILRIFPDHSWVTTVCEVVTYPVVSTVDGPSGSKLEVKAGAILMARIANVPIVPGIGIPGTVSSFPSHLLALSWQSASPTG